MKTLIKNVRIVDGGEIQSGHILVENRRISAILPLGAEIDEGIVYDFSGLYASAGFIDTHTHGGGGHDFMDRELVVPTSHILGYLLFSAVQKERRW